MTLMATEKLVELPQRILAAAPDMEIGQRAVVVLADASAYNTGRTYATAKAAFSQATRIGNQDEFPTYVVYRHLRGTTVYLDASTVLHTEPVPA